ncbi:intercellular adhesion molecule 4 [Rhynchocyon petersi]
MGSQLPLLLFIWLAAANSGVGNARGRWAARKQVLRRRSLEPSGTQAPFWVRLSPKLVEVPPGGSVWLNCSSSCPLPEDSGLHTRLQRGKTRSGPGWVSYQLLNIRAWSSVASCFVTCQGETRWATARVTAYKRPHSVILEPPVFVGSEYTLRCHVTHVFPVNFLVVSLRRGGRVIYSESLERFTRLDLANVTLTYVLPHGVRDLWQPVTCHARLNLDGLVVRSSSTPLTVTTFVWNTQSTVLCSTSIAALMGILLAGGAIYLRRFLMMQAQGGTSPPSGLISALQMVEDQTLEVMSTLVHSKAFPDQLPSRPAMGGRQSPRGAGYPRGEQADSGCSLAALVHTRPVDTCPLHAGVGVGYGFGEKQLSISHLRVAAGDDAGTRNRPQKAPGARLAVTKARSLALAHPRPPPPLLPPPPWKPSYQR